MGTAHFKIGRIFRFSSLEVKKEKGRNQRKERGKNGEDGTG